MNLEQVLYTSAVMKFCLLMISWFHGDICFEQQFIGLGEDEILEKRIKLFFNLTLWFVHYSTTYNQTYKGL
jgi:hypothetical protein